MAGKSRAYLTVVDDQEVLVPRKKTRSTRNGGVKPEIKEKFLEERNNPPPVVAKTANRKNTSDFLKTLK